MAKRISDFDTISDYESINTQFVPVSEGGTSPKKLDLRQYILSQGYRLFQNSTKTISFTAEYWYEYVCDHASTQIVATLPSASTEGEIRFAIANDASLKFVCDGSDTILGNADLTFYDKYKSFTIKSDGVSKWWIY